MARVLLSGYYGFGNVGDEAILASTVLSLRERSPGIEISVLSANPAETARSYGVETYGRMSPREVASGVLASDLRLNTQIRFTVVKTAITMQPHHRAQLCAQHGRKWMCFQCEQDRLHTSAPISNMFRFSW